MHAYPKGVMCVPESAISFAANERTNQTKSIVDLLSDRCTAVASSNCRLPSDHRSSVETGTCDEISSDRPRQSNRCNSSNGQPVSSDKAPSGTDSLANASNKRACSSSFQMSHSSVHQLDSAAKSSMRPDAHRSAEPNRTSRFGQSTNDEPRAVALPPIHQPATCSHSPPPFSFYLLNSSSSCNSHPATRSSPPSTSSCYLTTTKLSHSSSHSPKLSPCSPKATKPNSPIIGKQAASASSFIIIALLCLILQLVGVQAASTAFDYQNQADNSIVYQGTHSALLIIRPKVLSLPFFERKVLSFRLSCFSIASGTRLVSCPSREWPALNQFNQFNLLRDFFSLSLKSSNSGGRIFFQFRFLP